MPTLAGRASRSAVALAVLLLAAVAAVIGFTLGGDDPAAAPAGVQQRFEQVVQTVSPQVVEIRGQKGLGSGVVFDDSAHIVTNAHVIAGEKQFTVTLSGGDRHPATLVGSDTAHDLAVVRVTGAKPAAATFADTPTPPVGALVLAIGNPLGLRSSVTQGIVSSLNRSVSEGRGVTLSPVIQTSAAINPGNSGGALVDLDGKVIGIPTLGALDPQLGGGQASGIGFAIPSATVRKVAAGLIASG
jgi:S1-C subfamily serine protease